MSSQDDLIKSVRSGKLREVCAALDAGAPIDDELGRPGLPLAMACFLGYTDIVRELVRRGGKVNFADNSNTSSPLSMALRGNRREVVRLLIEDLGAIVPENMLERLDESERALVRGRVRSEQASSRMRSNSAVEEIDLVGCYGTDTVALEADVMHFARQIAATKKK